MKTDSPSLLGMRRLYAVIWPHRFFFRSDFNWWGHMLVITGVYHV